MVTQKPLLAEFPLADLIGALHEAFLEELGDEEMAQLAVQTLIQEHLLDGTWVATTAGEDADLA